MFIDLIIGMILMDFSLVIISFIARNNLKVSTSTETIGALTNCSFRFMAFVVLAFFGRFFASTAWYRFTGKGNIMRMTGRLLFIRVIYDIFVIYPMLLLGIFIPDFEADSSGSFSYAYFYTGLLIGNILL